MCFQATPVAERSSGYKVREGGGYEARALRVSGRLVRWKFFVSVMIEPIGVIALDRNLV